jgi:hypothetical protein
MIAYSLFINLYFTIIGYVYSRDCREWWDLDREEKDELLRKHLPEDEYPDELEGSFPEGWFEFDEWEKKAVLDKNLYDYYKDEQTPNYSRDFFGISKRQTNEESRIRGRCVIV